MTLALAGAYAVAAMAFLGALALGRDASLERRLGAGGASPPPPLPVRLGARLRFAPGRAASARISELGLGPDEVSAFRARKALLAAGGAAVGAVAGSPEALLAAPLLAAAGFRVPDVRLARAVERRRREIAAAVPQLLDVVAVAVSAGLSARLALDRSPGAVSGLLGAELVAARHEVELGGSWRSALRGIAERCRSPDLRRLAVVFDRAERLGVPVAERLEGLSRDVRAERRARREERAQRAPVHMLFPLVFLILPAFVLSAVIPAVIVATRGLS